MAVDEWQVALFLSTFVLGLLVHKWMRSKSKNESSSVSSRSDLVLDVIRNRRSVAVSKMNGERLTHTELKLILEAANWAPTHGCTEPWRFVIISGSVSIESYFDFLDKWYCDHGQNLDEEALDKFRTKLASVREEWPWRVSHLLVTVMKRQARPDKLMPEWEELCATAMAVQNAHLMASTMDNVAFFWSSHTWCRHARDSPEMKKYLNMEEEDKVLGALCLGRHDADLVLQSARGNVEDKVAYRMD